MSDKVIAGVGHTFWGLPGSLGARHVVLNPLGLWVSGFFLHCLRCPWSLLAIHTACNLHSLWLLSTLHEVPLICGSCLYYVRSPGLCLLSTLCEAPPLICGHRLHCMKSLHHWSPSTLLVVSHSWALPPTVLS